MPLQSLDDIVADKAANFAAALLDAAKKATKEEEIRIATEKQLAFLEAEAGIKLEGKHEFTVASGRVDSVYDRVIIEYKNPSSASACIGPTLTTTGSKKLVEQIKSRFTDLQTEHGHPINSLLGVGLDGNRFIFVRFRGGKWFIEEPSEVNKQTCSRFIWGLFNLGRRGKPFSPDVLAQDFGASADITREGVKVFYNSACNLKSAKANVLLSQWKILFGEVCGYNVNDPSDKIKVLATSYDIPTKNLQPAELLFSIHTYYAIFMKMLAAEVVAFFHKLPTPLERMLQSSTSGKFLRELKDLENGSVFRHLNISNFLEGDIFSWYVDEWSPDVEKVLRRIVERLDMYNPGTLSEEPAGSRDLLKLLYQELFPRSVRHDLGEYYTPDWLAQHVIDEVGYVGRPEIRVLDPACGSGTFLVLAINQARKWYEEHRHEAQMSEKEFVRALLANVAGFDLNPLAVMAARTNYLIAIRDLLSYLDQIEIPVYLCDSILTPSEHGGLFGGGLGKSMEIKTAVADFIVPSEVTLSRQDVGRYADQIEFCIEHKYTSAEFLSRCLEEGLSVQDTEIHSNLYDTIAKLDKDKKNGIWARIIKNAFAPLFIGKFDVVVGNPPWVNWRNLPADYRAGMAPLWERYGLFTQKGLNARLGAGMDDISVLMTYVSADTYLKSGGSLGLVLTQTLFQSAGGGQGFRSFTLPHGQFLKVANVFDCTSFQPFEAASNKTAAIIFNKGTEKNTYPVPYCLVSPASAKTAKPSLLGSTFEASLSQREAVPISDDNTSPWSILPTGMGKIAAKMRGNSPFVARVGAHSGGAAGVFWVKVEKQGAKSSLISNLWDAGTNVYPQVTASVEASLVRPLLRGRDVQRWTANPSINIIMPYMPENDGKAISEAVMKLKYPKTFAYFDNFRKKMLARPHYIQHFKSAGAPFWSMYNVGNYTFSPFRVVWREQASSFTCAVVGDDDGGSWVADAKLVTVACGSSKEAHYLAGVLNSSPSRFFIDSYSVKTQVSTHVFRYLKVPAYSPKAQLHLDIASQAKACRSLIVAGKAALLAAAEEKLDGLVAGIWGLSATELKAVRSYVCSS